MNWQNYIENWRLQFCCQTHNQTEAMTLGTRIVVMKDGVVQQVESPANIYNNPRNQFVAGFIGSPSMNFFDAYIGEEEGRTTSYFRGRAGKRVVSMWREQGTAIKRAGERKKGSDWYPSGGHLGI